MRIEDSSDSSESNISDNYDSNEEDFSSEQADDQNIQNHQLNLGHADDQQAFDQATQNPQSTLQNPTIQHVTFQNLKYQLPDENEIKEAKVLGRVDHATGINKYWVNIQKHDDSMCSVNLEQLKQWKEIEDNEELSQAKAKELQK